MKRSVAGAVLSAVLVLGGLTGCGGDGAKPSPSASASVPVLSASPGEVASVAPSPGQKPTRPIDVDPPERPAAMDNADEAGAIAAAEYFLRLTVYASVTGNTTELEAMSGEDCKSCQSFISTATKRDADRERRVNIPEIQLSESQQWIESDKPLMYQVEFEARKGSYEYYSLDGQLKTVPEEHVIFALRPVFEDSWFISAAQSFSLEEAAMSQTSAPK
ncbi:MAG: DUF6318 family protein [Ancrocorticia sp.]